VIGSALFVVGEIAVRRDRVASQTGLRSEIGLFRATFGQYVVDIGAG